MMGKSSDDTERKQCLEFIQQVFNDAVMAHTSEILFRPEKDRIQTFTMRDGIYEKGLAIPSTLWKQVIQVLKSDYFEKDKYTTEWQNRLYTFEWIDDEGGVVRFLISTTPVEPGREGEIEDLFSAFEDPSWDGIKSIFLSILNLALEQGYDGLSMELDGPVVHIMYTVSGRKGTSMTISSDSYDSLARLVGENYLAFGFMTREFREKEFLIRLIELNEDDVAPRIRLEIEELR